MISRGMMCVYVENKHNGAAVTSDDAVALMTRQHFQTDVAWKRFVIINIVIDAVAWAWPWQQIVSTRREAWRKWQHQAASINDDDWQQLRCGVLSVAVFLAWRRLFARVLHLTLLPRRGEMMRVTSSLNISCCINVTCCVCARLTASPINRKC